MNEQQVIKGRRTLCKLLNKGLISEPVERLCTIQDVSKLKQLLYKNERHLRRQYSKQPKTLLLKNALDFKNIFSSLEQTSSGAPINNTPKNINSNDRPNETLRQYYLKRLSARVPKNTDRNLYSDKFIETAVRCYVEGFQWHITYLDLCAAKSATLRQQYVTQQKRKNRGVTIKSEQMKKCETVFIATTNLRYHQTGDSIDAQANDTLVTKLNQLNLNSHNNNCTSSTLPTIVLTDCSEETSDTNSVIFINHEIIDQLRTPAIACHVEARPPSN